MSIASEISRINGNIAAAYSACEDKGAAMPGQKNSANLADTIGNIPAGGGQADQNTVVFYDYDGSVLYKYTAVDAMALSEFPAQPAHEGLTAKGWSLTLRELQEYVNEHGACEAGALYTTNDGTTRLYLSLDDGASRDFTLYFSIANGTLSVEVDGAVLGSVTIESTSYSRQSIGFTIPSNEAVVVLRFTGEGGYRLGGKTVAGGPIFGPSNQPSELSALKKIEIGENVNGFASKAFQNYSGLSNVVIPPGLTSLGTYLFNGCTALKSIVIPRGATSIPNYCFDGCSALGDICMPFTITSIGTNAFNDCKSLESVTIPKEVTSVKGFIGCTALKHISIPEGVTSISDFRKCTSLTSIYLPSTLKSISSALTAYAFQDTPIKSIVLPTSYAGSSGFAFTGCKTLQRAVIQQGVTKIGNAFIDASSLKSILIPSSVTEIVSYEFSGCSSLKYIDLSEYTQPEELPTMENTNALTGTPSNQIIWVYDQACLDALSAMTNWSTYADRIKVKEA